MKMSEKRKRETKLVLINYSLSQEVIEQKNREENENLTEIDLLIQENNRRILESLDTDSMIVKNTIDTGEYDKNRVGHFDSSDDEI